MTKLLEEKELAEIMLTQDLLKKRLRYDPDTGNFVWLQSTPKFIGKKAGTDGPHGYGRISIDRHAYYSHRLAWLYMTGGWPEEQIDHINGIRHDNRWSNLRLATKSENQQNVFARKRNTSGYPGVYFHKPTRKWSSHIWDSGRRKYLGLFEKPELASAAYLAAKKALHPFANFDRLCSPSATEK